MRQNSLDVKALNQRNKIASESESSPSSRDTKTITSRNANIYMNGTAAFNDRGDSEILTIHRHDTRRESLLDDLCESLADDMSYYSPSISTTTNTITRVKKLEFVGGGSPNTNGSASASNGHSNETHNGNNHPKSNGCVVNGRLDEKKKTKLLAALKHIDNGSSVEH